MRYDIIKESYTASLDAVVEKIEKRKINLDERHIVIVPDGYTFTLEKRLFLSGGAFDLEVTDFNRLYTRSFGANDKTISKQGAIMLLKKICHENAQNLVCYNRSALKTGFAVKLYDAITTLRSCSLSPADLDRVQGVSKMKDLALLYEEYLKETKGKYVDASGRAELLLEKINEGAFGDCHFYIALYDVMNSQIKKIISALDKHALSVTVAYASAHEGYKVRGEAIALACPDQPTQYKEVAKRIHSSVKSGAKYGEWVVVDESESLAVIKRIFDEYRIPYHANEKIALSSSELCRFVFTAISAVNRGYKTVDMLALCSNYYSGVSKADCDQFTTVVKARSIDYKGFFEPIVDNEGAERARARLVELLAEVEGKIKSARELSQKITALLHKANALQRTQELSKIDGRDLNQVYEKSVNLLQTMEEIFLDFSNGETLVEVLREGFEGTSLSLVPNRPDTVQIGGLSAFRGQKVKYAAVVNFNDGVLPSISFDDGLIVDADANKLGEYQLAIEPKNDEKNRLCRDELWHFLASVERLYLSRIDAEGSKPSFDYRMFVRKNNLTEETVLAFKDARNAEVSIERIAPYLGVESGAMEAIFLDYGFTEKLTTLHAMDMNESALERKEEGYSKIGVDGLFFRDGRTSISAIQKYYDCPYRYFLSYGLKLKEKEDGKITPIDVGLLLHKLVEIFVDDALPDDTEKFVEDNLERALAKLEKYRYKVNERMLERIKSEAVQLCKIVKRQIEAGSFLPLGSEISFGKEDSTLKTITLPSGVRLMGEIDRVDTFEDSARVIDYKTGSIKFEYGDLYFGKKIQLFIYSGVLAENGYRPAGLFYFPFAINWSDDEYTHRLTGAVDANFDNVIAMDRSVSEGGKSTIIDLSVRVSKNAKRDYYNSSKARTSDELYKLIDYAKAVADNAVIRIKEGKLYPSPAQGRVKVCEHCEYNGICGKGKIGRTVSGVKAEEIVTVMQGGEE